MLRVGLTGGIGSGKSTVARRLAELGALVIDADVLAREVVEPGSEGLATVADRFGTELVAADGSLDRAALGRVVFGDEQARRDLEGILHPRIAARTADLLEAAPRAATVVHDVPLLVEKAMGAAYHLVVVVGADEQTRVDRLVSDRGMSPAEARARIAAQATDEQRRAAADVWLDNGASRAGVEAAVDLLWEQRLAPYEANLLAGQRVRLTGPTQVGGPDPAWEGTGRRLTARLGHLFGQVAERVDHIGSTAVPGLAAKDVIDLQVGVRDLSDVDDAALLDRLARGGFVLAPGVHGDNSKNGSSWPKRFFGGCDPAQVVHVHVRATGSPGWAWALQFRDWLRAEPGERAAYESFKRDLAGRTADTTAYAAAKEEWFDLAAQRLRAWVDQTGWQA